MKSEKIELKKNFTKLTQKRGISLIVLIGTIIVIIILAAVVILAISKNNPLKSAKEARFKEDVRSFQYDLVLTISKDYTDNQGQRDNKITALDFDQIMGYIPSFTKEYENKLVIQEDQLVYVEDKVNEKEKKWLNDLQISSNSSVQSIPDDWKNSIASVTEDGVPVPKGFTYVTGTKNTGTVIQDDKRNQFVWIPATEANYVKDFNFRSNYSATSSNTTDDQLPNNMADEIADVVKYGGFYIGRYEAGIPTVDTSPSNKIGVPVCKQNAIVWTNISYTNAKASAESMYNTESVQSGLLTGKAWDRTCHWIADVVDIKDSRTYGNYSNSQAPANVTGYGNKQVAGFSDKWMTKNIYDLAGNVWEWTNESYSSYRILRGGSYFYNVDFPSVSYRGHDVSSTTYDRIGFRIRLYIN